MARDEDPTLGRIGGYRLVRRLATGGTSDVLLARAEGPHGFERTVVIKRLLSEHREDPDFARMFTQEASAYARLSHPAIVRLFDFFTKDNQLIMVIEFVDGVPLSRLMTTLHQRGQRLDTGSCLFIASRLFDALAAAHDAKNPETGDPTPVIHRDVNPSNVLLPWDGHAKLTDFGIAKITGSTDGTDIETVTGFIKGTFGYMAPEQVTGERVTIRTDVYAATLVLWELLAHRKAIQTDKLPEMEVLRAMAEPKLPALDVLRSDLPEPLREGIRRGLEPNPAKRSITAEEMVSILRDHMNADDARQKLVNALETLRPTGAKDELATTVVDSAALSRSTESTNELPATEGEATEREPQPASRPKPPPVLAQTGTGPTVVASPRVQTPSGFRPVMPSPPPTVPRSVDPLLQRDMMPTASTEVQPAPAPRAPPTPPLPPRAPGLQKTLAVPERPVGAPLPPQVAPIAAAPPLASAPPPAPAPLPAPAPAPAGFGGTLVMEPPATPLGPPPQLATPGTAPYPFGTTDAPRSQIPTGPSLHPPYVPPQPPPALEPIRQVPSQQKSNLGWVLGALFGVVVVGGLAAGGAWWFYRGRATPAPATLTSARPTASPTATTPTTTRATATTTASATSTAASTASVRPATSAATTAVASTSPSFSASAVTKPLVVPTTTASTPAPTAPTPALGANEGAIVLPASALGHRVWIDGKLKNNGESPITVACGKHTVQIGSAGAVQDLDVPCGGKAEAH
jgi:serine/threonine-protein kinase